MGVALPRPDSSAFHLMFVDASHVIGGSGLGAVPLASGPRQCGQLSARAEDVGNPTKTHNSKVLMTLVSMKSPFFGSGEPPSPFYGRAQCSHHAERDDFGRNQAST